MSTAPFALTIRSFFTARAWVGTRGQKPAPGGRDYALIWATLWRVIVIGGIGLMAMVALFIGLMTSMKMDIGNALQQTGFTAVMLLLEISLENFLWGLVIYLVFRKRTFSKIKFRYNGSESKTLSYMDSVTIFWAFAWRIWLLKFLFFCTAMLGMKIIDIVQHSNLIAAALANETWMKLGVRFDGGLFVIALMAILRNMPNGTLVGSHLIEAVPLKKPTAGKE